MLGYFNALKSNTVLAAVRTARKKYLNDPGGPAGLRD